MSYQPPQPPPPPPPPPGAYGRRPGGFDPKTVNPLDWAILGIGFLVFIFSFVDYVSAGPFGINAWHFTHWTFLTWFAMVFGVLAGAAVAVHLFMPQVQLPWPNRVLGLELFALSFVLYFIAIFVHFDFEGVASHAFGFWASLVLVAAGAVLSLMRVQQTGGQLPGALSNLPDIGHYGPQQPPPGA